MSPSLINVGEAKKKESKEGHTQKTERETKEGHCDPSAAVESQTDRVHVRSAAGRQKRMTKNKQQ